MEVTAPHIDFSLTQSCNYSCNYCHASTETPKEKFSLKHLLKMINGPEKIWTITLSGGEPMIHPDFINICGELTKQHKIRVNSNWTRKDVAAKFIRNIDPKNVLIMDISLHIEEREKKNGIQGFIDSVHELHQAGFKTQINYVLHPDLLNRVDADLAYFASKGIILIPKRFKGVHNNKTYPEAYEQSVRHYMEDYNQLSLNLTDYNFQGIPCNAGIDLFKIRSNGDVYRCPGDQTAAGFLGNINFGTFKPLTTPLPCQVGKCPCWGPQNVILDHEEAHLLKGLNAYLRGEQAEAEKEWQNALLLNPESFHALNNLSVLNAHKQDWMTAKEQNETAFKIKPTDKCVQRKKKMISDQDTTQLMISKVINPRLSNGASALKLNRKIAKNIYTKKLFQTLLFRKIFKSSVTIKLLKTIRERR
jgi:organic radical activating enzyme